MKTNLILTSACFLSVLALSTFAWTQDSAPKETITKFGVISQFGAGPNSLVGKSIPVPRPFPPGGFGGGGADGGFVAGGFASGPTDVMTQGGLGTGLVFNVPNGPMRAKVVTDTLRRVVYEPVPPEELENAKAFEEALKSLKSAKSDDEKKKATDVIAEQLFKQFDKDLAAREKELVSVEQRLKTLREQFEKRKVSKDEIVKLRLKTIMNNAEGLGFPGEDFPAEGSSLAPEGATGSVDVFNSIQKK